jgi:uncharacterized membrane-anchored protein YhcB (DUF1043 family)
MDHLIQIILFLLLGVLIYYLDSSFGLRLYRSWYGMTHKEPLPESEVKGFLINQPMSSRISVALVITSIGAVISFLSPRFWDNTLQIVLTIMALAVGLVVGFMFAPAILKAVPGRVKKVVDYAEQVESGEADMEQDIKGAIQDLGKNVGDLTKGSLDNIKQSATDAVQDMADAAKNINKKKSEKSAPGEERNTSSESNKPEEDEAPKDWRKGVDDFLGK